MKIRIGPLALIRVGLTASTFASFAASDPELITRVESVPDASQSAAGDSFATAASPDGRYVLFSSFARNLSTNRFAETGTPTASASATLDVYLRDRASKRTVLISGDRGKTGTNVDSWSHPGGLADTGF